MKCLLSVCLIASLAAAIVHVVERPVNASQETTPTLQLGVSVTMAGTSNAQPMPEADSADAWIVTVIENGSLYFGTNAVSPESLMEEMKSRPRNREQKLYIKADARAPFAKVERVFEAGREVAFGSAVLLTAQPAHPSFGTVAPPNGLEVLTGPALPAGTVATVVQLLNSRQEGPLLRVNDDEISRSALESTLRQHFQKGDNKVILLKADTRLQFGQVVQVIDACRAAGATVVMAPPVI
jgi:biopolymer transport protein ExbD